MTPQEFSGLLEQPLLLYQLPLPDLQALAVRFPYSPNLRLLLLLKTHLEGHEQEASYLNRCAAASFDRAHLYDLLRELDAVKHERDAREEETLELRELDALELEPLPAGNRPESPLEENTLPEPPPRTVEGDSPLPSSIGNEALAAAFGDGERSDFLPSLPDLPEPPDLPGPPQPPQGGAERETGTAEEEREAVTAATPPTSGPEEPTPLPDGLRGRLVRIRQLQRSRTKNDREDVNRIAQRSLVAHEEVASETLAGLLVRQGQYQNAIRMYQRLLLLYPEKKAIFAGLIEDLQEKL